MMQPGRKYSNGSSYRYGFNGKENDKNISEGGQDYGMRVYDGRLAKFLSVDPLIKSYPWYTPYQFAGNKPVIAIDLDGLEEKIVIASFVSRSKPAIQTQSAIVITDEMEAHENAIMSIMNRLDLEELNNPIEPKNVGEYGTMGKLTVNEKREVIENTVREFTICISTSKQITPNFNTNFVTETFTATYDFDYTLLGNKEKIDDIKSALKIATTIVEYSGKIRDMTGKLPKVLDKITGPASIVGGLVEGNGLDVTTEVGKMLVEKGLEQLAKKAPSLAPIIEVAKSNPATLTIQFTFMNSAPENKNSDWKEKNIEKLRMKTIGALLLLFENNNKKYTVQAQSLSEHSDVDNTRLAPKLSLPDIKQ